MTSLNKTINRRVGSLFAVAALVLATVTPGLIPAFASAAQVTERSVQLSSSSKGSDAVSYTVNFTPEANAGAFVVDFCTNSPLIGASCTGPGVGFSVAAVDTETASWTAAETTATGAIAATGTITADTPVTVQFDGINNPDTAGIVYARIVTFVAGTDAAAYTSTVPGANKVDEGSAAFTITNTIGVSAAVSETLTFCVAGNQITAANCTRGDAAALTAPTLRLGEGTGATQALVSTAVSEGNIYSQLSTNAASGAVVNLKSGNECGGLKRAETDADVCDIAAAAAGGIANGEAKLGVKVATGSDPSGASGTFQIAGAGAFYSASVFKLNYNTDKSVGVTSVFGDSVLDTAGGPVNNKNAQITFGASIANNTPAGLYTNDYSLIATGKY